MQGKKEARRSGCPINACLEMFGDRWSLLIVRDLLFNGRTSYGAFAGAGEGIATNVLADRLQRLEAAGILCAHPHPEDARKVRYALTAKGIDLAPVLVEMVLWATRYEDTDAPPAVVRAMRTDRNGFLAALRRRQQQADKRPPRTSGHSGGRRVPVTVRRRDGAG